MKKRSVSVCAVAMILVCGTALRAGAQSADARETGSTPAAAAPTSVPRLVQFNGTLKDTAVRPVSGVASVTFSIYADQDGGSPLWTETQNVLADSNGHFASLLGTATTGGFPSELFSTGQSRWLGVTIARSPEMPRVMLASVPYAMKAGDADTLGGIPASSYVTAQQLASRTTIAATSTTIVSSPFAAVTPSANAAATPGADATQLLGGNSGPQAAITGTGTSNYLPLWTSGSNIAVSKIYQANGGFVGINTNTPLLQLDVNGNSIFRGSFQMAPQGTATATAGQPSHSFQWQGSVFNSSTKAAQNEAFGFRTVPATNNTSSPTTKLDLFYGPGGSTLNDTGLSISNSGVVTFVAGQQFNGASESVNEINLPNTTGASTGVINFGGQAFITNGGDSSNAFVGAGAGNSFASTGGVNTAIGGSALGANTSGFANTAVGNAALVGNKTGSYSTAVGGGAMQSMVQGTENTAVGALAQLGLTTGNFDTSVGVYAGRTNSTGSENTFLGVEADATVGDLTNATAIGFLASVGESNALALGGSGTHSVNVGIGTGTPSHTLEVLDRGGAGVYATSTIPGDSAVYGVSNSTSPTAGTNGGLFQSSSPAGAGVVGINNAAGYAGYFEAMGGGYAGYFLGDVTVTGTLTKGGGSFKIDDPIDPAGKYLSHSFVESPDMKNIYDGIVTLDTHGSAVVTMPEWFGALNRDFRYQLTAIGAPGPKLYIAEEMNGNSFRIAGGKKGMRVSWEVTGIRQDAWANAHRIPTEEAKPANEQGRYLHPELFGAGPDKSVATMPIPTPAISQATAASADATGRR